MDVGPAIDAPLQSQGKYKRRRQIKNPVWRFVARVIQAVEDRFTESEEPVPVTECVKHGLQAAAGFNTSIALWTESLANRLGNDNVRRILSTGTSFHSAVLMLRRRLTSYSARQDTLERRCEINTCGGWFLRSAYVNLAYLHAAAFHLSDSLDGVPQPAPKIHFHFDLGVARRDVQRALLWKKAREVAPGAVFRMAELGVDEAKGVITLLGNFQNLQYIGVDPYLPCEVERCWPSPEERYGAALSRLMRFKGRAHLLRATSTDAADFIKDASIDFIFVDALHTYEAAAADLRHWIPKLRRGGIICGHDYSGAYPGVLDAVHEVFNDFPSRDRILHLAPDYTYFWRPHRDRE